MASYDSRSQAAQVTGSMSSETTGVGSWTATATAETLPEGQTSINASGTYVGNRADVTVSHASGFTGIGYNGGLDPHSLEEATTVGVSTSFVYADGAWGVGRR